MELLLLLMLQLPVEQQVQENKTDIAVLKERVDGKYEEANRERARIERMLEDALDDRDDADKATEITLLDVLLAVGGGLGAWETGKAVKHKVRG